MASGETSFSEKIKRFSYSIDECFQRRSPRLQQSSAPSPSAALSPSISPLKRGRSSSSVVENQAKRRSSGSGSRRTSSKYAAPSRYAHLSPLVDALEPDLLLVFVGVNPGVSTAIAGHAYAHPSNRFWHLLHVCGLTPERKLSPSEDRSLPKLYRYGHTNIVSRPTKDQSELSKEEMVEGATVLEQKFRQCKPEAVCLVGKGIWEAIWKRKHGRSISKAEFKYGWQDARENMGQTHAGDVDTNGRPWKGARVFVATSTSGLAASMSPAEKEAIWKVLGDWVAQRRKEIASEAKAAGRPTTDQIEASS